jgi:hypothetical protein
MDGQQAGGTAAAGYPYLVSSSPQAIQEVPQGRDRDWHRVSPGRPCPICNKHDWCLIAQDGSAVICARIKDGAARQCGDAGWLHRLRDDLGWPRSDFGLRARLRRPAVPSEEMAAVADEYQAAVDRRDLAALARRLGVSAASLDRLAIGWDERSRAWSFPMGDGRGRITGIRLRTAEGRKFAVKGSREGLFVPSDLDAHDRLLVAEGPTDTAALLDLGLAAVGRPSCRGGRRPLTDLVRRLAPREVVIIADGDEVGQDGALALVQRLVIHARRVRIVTPPAGIKDARAWRRAGATGEVLLGAIEAAEVHRVEVRGQIIPAAPGGGRHGG